MADSRFAVTGWASLGEEDVEDDMKSPSPCEGELRPTVLSDLCRTDRALLAEGQEGENGATIVYICYPK